MGNEIKSTFDAVLKYGKKKVGYVEDVEDLRKNLKSILERNDAVLIKGSRSVALERLLEEELNHVI